MPQTVYPQSEINFKFRMFNLQLKKVCKFVTHEKIQRTKQVLMIAQGLYRRLYLKTFALLLCACVFSSGLNA